MFSILSPIGGRLRHHIDGQVTVIWIVCLRLGYSSPSGWAVQLPMWLLPNRQPKSYRGHILVFRKASRGIKFISKTHFRRRRAFSPERSTGP